VLASAGRTYQEHDLNITQAGPGDAGTPPRPPVNSLRWDVVPLAVAQTIIWATMYYSFPALLLEWESDLGWSKTEISGAFTAALVIAALLAPMAGKLIDRGAARLIHPAGAALGAVMLAVLSQVTELWQFYAVWVGMGLAMSVSLYEACFAIITVTVGSQARIAITMVTLFAGFAGTVSFPSAHFLSGAFGWRGAAMTFAVVDLVLVIPLIIIGLRWLERHRRPDEDAGAADDKAGLAAAGTPVTRRPAFWLLAVAFGSMGLVHGLVLSHLLPILADRGIAETTAVLAASMIGPMQVLGRIVMIATERRVNIFGVALTAYLGMGIGCTALLFAGASPWLVAVFVVVHGASYGTGSIVRPILTAELLGRRRFGVTSGMLAVPFMGGFAIAPTASALLWELGGYDLVLGLAAGVAIAGIGVVMAASRVR
jgi:MFS family permease